MTHLRRALAAAALGALAAAAPAGDGAVPSAYREEIRLVLRRSLECGDRATVSAAAAALARAGDGAAAPTLLHLLRTGDEAARRSAAEGLGDLGDPAALPELLVSLWKDCDPAVRGAAAVAAARLGGVEAAAPLRAEWDRSLPRADRRRAASLAGLAEALGILGDPRDLDRLSSMIVDESVPAPARAAAAGALANYADPHAVLTLVDALHRDPAPGVRRAAALALAWMAREEEGPRGAPVTLFAGRDAFTTSRASGGGE